MDVIKFYLHVSRLCEAAGISERKLSEMITDDSNYISSTKAQKRLPTVDKLEKMAAALNMPLSKFFAGLEDNDEISVLLYAKMKTLTEYLDKKDSQFYIRYLQSIEPEEFEAFIAHLRKTVQKVKE